MDTRVIKERFIETTKNVLNDFTNEIEQQNKQIKQLENDINIKNKRIIDLEKTKLFLPLGKIML